MIMSFQQIQDVVAILRQHQYVLIAEQLGVNYLTDAEKAILIAAGVDLNKFTNSQGIIEHAFLFGLLAEAIGDDRAKDMSYQQFKDFIKSGNFVPLTEAEEYALEQVKNRAYTDIVGLGNRISSQATNMILQANAQEQARIRDIIKQQAINAVKYRKTATQLASAIGHAVDEWERDWLRIAQYTLHSAYNQGRAKTIFKEHGEDAEIYFDVLDGACKHCCELYLTDPDDVTSEPKTFKLKDVLANGNNIGRKAKDYLPSIDPIHPYCFNSEKTKIYTSKGFVNISDIKVGDLVLTHKGRFRKVTQIFKRPYQDEDIYHVYYLVKDQFGNKKTNRLSFITGNHPVLASGKWVAVKNLKPKDKIEIKVLKCSNCRKCIDVRVNNTTLLSKQLCLNCHRKMSAKEQWKDKEFREYMSNCVKNEMKLRYGNMTFEERQELTKNSRQAIKDKYPDGHPWMEEAVKKANRTNGKKKTFIERKLLYFCEQLGVKAVTNIYLRNNGSFRNDVNGYFPDIFIPSLGIVLEADGVLWHKDKLYDHNRDLDIKDAFGFDTFRFSEEDIVEHGDIVFEQLKNIFNNHEGNFKSKRVTVIAVKKVNKNCSCNYLYNFSVEEDESYVADGVVVHNCRCTCNYRNPKFDWNSATRSFTIPKKYVPKNKKLQNIKLNISVKKS